MPKPSGKTGLPPDRPALTSDHFFISRGAVAGEGAVLRGEEHHHLSRVLRARPGETVWLFDEELVPVCSPALLERTGKPLRRAHDLAHYVLLDLEDPGTPASWLGWSNWFDALDVRELKPAGLLGFNYFDQIVRAALAGQGVALGRLPLIADLLQDGSLVATLDARLRTDRAYWVVQAESARGRPEVHRLVEWIAQTARGQAGPEPRARTG